MTTGACALPAARRLDAVDITLFVVYLLGLYLGVSLQITAKIPLTCAPSGLAAKPAKGSIDPENVPAGGSRWLNAHRPSTTQDGPPKRLGWTGIIFSKNNSIFTERWRMLVSVLPLRVGHLASSPCRSTGRNRPISILPYRENRSPHAAPYAPKRNCRFDGLRLPLPRRLESDDI